ncbi:PA2169 family four-helix-bundle protein [Pendulispora rubella]|uniref:PA2169 family four-helix-bundle protein n=1 Tax=Pendulispora rubella TaxID=2741070 RepID=A0ABZ2KXE1_9BACT
MVVPTIDSELVVTLNRLIVADYDAIEAYEAAIPRLSVDEDQRTLRRFVEDHQRHIEKLAFFVRQNGGRPVDHADLRRIVAKGKVVIGGFMGDDAVLGAMCSNEQETNDVYARAGTGSYAQPLRLLLARYLDDERQHREWLERRITMTPKGETILPCL